MSGFAKLSFRHGPVSSAKTLNLLAVAHTYRVQGKSVVILKVSVLDSYSFTKNYSNMPILLIA